jgi:DNA-directed RNA polymerase III subunit RPC8
MLLLTQFVAAQHAMFVLSLIEDVINIHPQNFGNELRTIEDEVEKKFAGKVLLDVGMCVCFHDIVDIGPAYVYTGDGVAHATVKFRVVVFRPFIGEVIMGTISSSTTEGLKATLGFFDAVTIPASVIHGGSDEQNYKFNTDTNEWFWDYEGSALNMPVGAHIRFRVESIVYNPPTSITPTEGEGEGEQNKQPQPMVIHATICGSGLGMDVWWSQQ